jgi:hypothetical protein
MKYISFQRALNHWKFERVKKGPEKGSFLHHKLFLGDKRKSRLMTYGMTSRRFQKLSDSNLQNLEEIIDATAKADGVSEEE